VELEEELKFPSGVYVDPWKLAIEVELREHLSCLYEISVDQPFAMPEDLLDWKGEEGVGVARLNAYGPHPYESHPD
jgi:hypothetical protein